MTWNVITVAFGDKKYKRGQRFLTRHSRKCGVNHINYSEVDLLESDLSKEVAPEWMSADNNYGWFTWKPYFILKTMEKLQEGDKVFFLDALDIYHPEIFNYVDEVMGDDPCLLPLGNSRNGDYTKKDCFVYMECDEEDYWESRQLEAGFTFWKVCDESKKILREWLEWCLNEKVGGDMSGFSNLKEDEDFKECRHDQSILTNMAVRDGLPVIDSDIRSLIECNADYWYERLKRNAVQIYRPVDEFMMKIRDEVDYIKADITDSIILTLHNKEELVEDVLAGIEDYTKGLYELIIVFDGCTDNTEDKVINYMNNSSLLDRTTFKYADNVFETKANNIGLKEAVGTYAIIVQDDMIIKEGGWNQRLRKPFDAFDDVFAVTARTAHNYVFNPESPYIGMEEDIDTGWCNIVEPCDEANRSNISRDVFAVRGTVNRGPLMIKLEDLKELDYFDEAFSPQDMDDHDLMFRMRKKLGKVCGCYWIDFESEPSWGGTRKENGEPAPWLYKAQHKNSKIFYERNADVLEEYRINEDRELL